MKTYEDIGIISDSLEAFDNGRSDDWCEANESVNEVSTKPDDDKKSMPTVTYNDIAICPDKGSSLKTNNGMITFIIAAEIDFNVANCS